MISIGIQYYKRHLTLSETLNNITKYSNINIIIHNDCNSNFDIINFYLKNNTNNQQLFSSNIGELRAYTKIIESSHTNLVVLCQDDDIAPPNQHWIDDCIKCFNYDNKLAVLGLNNGKMYDNESPIGLIERNCNLGLIYVGSTSFGPWVIRKDYFNGFDLEFQKTPQACHQSDYAYCVDTWTRGLHVAIISTENTSQWIMKQRKKTIFTSDIQKEIDKNRLRFSNVYYPNLKHILPKIFKMNLAKFNGLF